MAPGDRAKEQRDQIVRALTEAKGLVGGEPWLRPHSSVRLPSQSLPGCSFVACQAVAGGYTQGTRALHRNSIQANATLPTVWCRNEDRSESLQSANWLTGAPSSTARRPLAKI